MIGVKAKQIKVLATKARTMNINYILSFKIYSYLFTMKPRKIFRNISLLCPLREL